jgi:hypothetical protein
LVASTVRFGCLAIHYHYRDKKVVGVFVRFSCAASSDFSDPIINTLPYVIFKRNIADHLVTLRHFLTIKKVSTWKVPRRSNK